MSSAICEDAAMGRQAPGGWYPDDNGNERYWDGFAWTDQVRTPLADQPKQGGLASMGAAVKKVAADRRVAKQDAARRHADTVRAAGSLVTTGVFGDSTIEIYEGGYVRIATWGDGSSSQGKITKSTPYERLRSIKFSAPSRDQGGSRGNSALEGAVGPAVASLMKGGAGLMKASAPGLAVAGLAHFAGAEGRKSFLTIVTDKQIHNLTNQTHNGLIGRTNKGHNDVGEALEAAGNSVLGVDLGRAGPEPVAAEASSARVLHPGVLEASAGGPSLSERLRELAALHSDGILSDDEFAAAKGTLLGGL